MAEFKYQEPFPIQKDSTEYRLLTKNYVKTIEVEGRKILKIQKEGLELLAREAYADVSFYLSLFCFKRSSTRSTLSAGRSSVYA